MSDSPLNIEQKDKIAILKLNRPEKKNAFNLEMWKALEETVTIIKKKLPRVIVITGEGSDSFSAGFDVNPENPQVASLISAVQNNQRNPVLELVQYIRKTTDSLVQLPVPIIAAVNGLAYGGGAELATRCDLRVMDPDAVICFSEVTLGLMPDWGGGVALSRLLGSSKAADLILTARKISAAEALSLGLINRISSKNESLKEALEMADTIASKGPRSVRSALKVIRDTPAMKHTEALDNETETAATLIASGECIHGITAFLKGEKPEFPDIDD